MVPVVGGFPSYVGDPEGYMHLRRSQLMIASTDQKNAITILNELYYESAVYTPIHDGNESDPFSTVSVTVDGITEYGRGVSRKEAKLSAASAAVEHLRSLGILQQRISEKELSKANAASKTSSSEKRVPYRNTVCPVIPENAIAKLNHTYGGLKYNVIDFQMEAGGDFNNEIAVTSYTVSVNVNGQEFTGTGRSKKSARLAAAESALHALNLWTEEDEAAKREARLSALASRKMANTPVAAAWPVSHFTGRPRGFPSHSSIRGKPAFPARRIARGPAMRGRGMRGSFLQGQTYGFLSQPGIARAPTFRGRGSSMLRRGTRGGALGFRGAKSNYVGQVEIPEDKNPVMLLNEVYYSSAVFEFPGRGQMSEGTGTEECCTATVDGITAYGVGPTRKDAKTSAATAAVQQLMAAGILQKRLADKAAFMSQKHALLAERKQYYVAQSRGVPVQDSARMHRGRGIPGNRGRAPAGRGRGAQRRGSRGVGGRGLPTVQSYYPQQAHTDVTTDFTTFEDSSFISFEDTVPNRGTVAGRPNRNPRTANAGRRPGRMLNYY